MKLPVPAGQRIFGIDVRGLAVFRMLAGLALFIDLAIRFQVLEKFYTDAGAVPSSLVPELGFSPWFWTFHTYFGSWWGQAALAAVAGVFYAMLLLGYRTRPAAVLSYIFLVSAQNRNILVSQGCDQVLLYTQGLSGPAQFIRHLERILPNGG